MDHQSVRRYRSPIFAQTRRAIHRDVRKLKVTRCNSPCLRAGSTARRARVFSTSLRLRRVAACVALHAGRYDRPTDRTAAVHQTSAAVIAIREAFERRLLGRARIRNRPLEGAFFFKINRYRGAADESDRCCGWPDGPRRFAMITSASHGAIRGGYYGRAVPYRTVPQPPYRGESPCADPGAHIWCPPAPSRNGAAESAGSGWN